MKYLSLRVDCTQAAAHSIKNRLLSVLSPLGVIVRATYGHEVSLKAKKPHFHWHVQIEETQPFRTAFSQWVKREYDKLSTPLGEDPLHHYSIKVLKEPPDDRWFRYPYKDLEQIEPEQQVGFTEQQLHDMLLCATNEREMSKKTFEKHENKLNNDKQSRALMWEWLDEQFPQKFNMAFNPDRSEDPYYKVAAAIVEYNSKYNDHKIPMDLKRRTVCYLSYRGVSPHLLASIIL